MIIILFNIVSLYPAVLYSNTSCGDNGDPTVASCDALHCTDSRSLSSGGSLSSGESSTGHSSGGDCLQGLIDDSVDYMAMCTSEDETASIVQLIRDFLDF